MGDLFCEMGRLFKEYENGLSIESNKEEDLYSITQIIELYPMLSKHILTNAINDGDLKVTWIGNKRHFYLKDVENYLRKREEKIINNIPETIETWRNNV